MALSHEHIGYKKLANINTNMLTRAELLITLCYEIPCMKKIILLFSSSAFSLSTPTFLLSTSVENSEATLTKATKRNKIII